MNIFGTNFWERTYAKSSYSHGAPPYIQQGSSSHFLRFSPSPTPVSQCSLQITTTWSMQLRATKSNFEQNRTLYLTAGRLFSSDFKRKSNAFRQCYCRGFFSVWCWAVIWRLMLNTRWDPLHLESRCAKQMPVRLQVKVRQTDKEAIFWPLTINSAILGNILPFLAAFGLLLSDIVEYVILSWNAAKQDD